MKALSTFIMAIFLVTSLSACGKTFIELRTDGDAIVDNSTAAASQVISTVGTIVKKIISAGFAVYDLGKKMVDDSKDNVGTVVNLATGADQTPVVPTK